MLKTALAQMLLLSLPATGAFAGGFEVNVTVETKVYVLQDVVVRGGSRVTLELHQRGTDEEPSARSGDADTGKAKKSRTATKRRAKEPAARAKKRRKKDAADHERKPHKKRKRRKDG